MDLSWPTLRVPRFLLELNTVYKSLHDSDLRLRRTIVWGKGFTCPNLDLVWIVRRDRYPASSHTIFVWVSVLTKTLGANQTRDKLDAGEREKVCPRITCNEYFFPSLRQEFHFSESIFLMRRKKVSCLRKEALHGSMVALITRSDNRVAVVLQDFMVFLSIKDKGFCMESGIQPRYTTTKWNTRQSTSAMTKDLRSTLQHHPELDDRISSTRGWR